MSRLHVREQVGLNLYSVIVHSPTPAGTNAVGNSWSSCILASSSPVTQMSIGNGIGQITNAEANQVATGAVMETQFQWGDDPNWTNQQRLDDLAVRATQAVNDAVATMQSRLKFFGHTVA
jgi:hypothetical protein